MGRMKRRKERWKEGEWDGGWEGKGEWDGGWEGRK